MHLCWKVVAAAVLLSIPVMGVAATCTMQDEMQPQDRSALAAAGAKLAEAVAGQDTTAVKAALLPAEASAWDGIRAAVEQAAALTNGGHVQFRDAFLLDASGQTGPADTEFFCTNSSGSMNITLSMHELPPGRYAVLLADALGAPLAGQMGIILGWDKASSSWLLAGLSVRPGALDGHDGTWYWKRARDLAKPDPWSAWYDYDIAAYLLLPVDFLISPNLDKLRQEQQQITPAPHSALPLSLPDGDRTWKIDAVNLDASLHEPDLGVAYESTGVTDPAALRTEATSVMSAFLKAEPGIRANFHGLWAYAVKNGQRTPVMELPMAKIP
ncbi:MAG TPA: hypothetical protein VGG26_10775 [Terracidiphilus sp.]|jgi:hypothetical protein